MPVYQKSISLRSRLTVFYFKHVQGKLAFLVVLVVFVSVNSIVAGL